MSQEKLPQQLDEKDQESLKIKILQMFGNSLSVETRYNKIGKRRSSYIKNEMTPIQQKLYDVFLQLEDEVSIVISLPYGKKYTTTYEKEAILEEAARVLNSARHGKQYVFELSFFSDSEKLIPIKNVLEEALAEISRNVKEK